MRAALAGSAVPVLVITEGNATFTGEQVLSAARPSGAGERNMWAALLEKALPTQ